MLNSRPMSVWNVDVAEAQGGHDRQGPVEPGDPGVFLALGVAHDQAESGGVQADGAQQQKHVLCEGLGVTPHLASGEER